MKYTSAFNIETSENTYLVYDEVTRNGVVIDPGCPMDGIRKMIEMNHVNVKYILLTHCHYDHIMSMIPLKELTGAEIVSGEKCSANIGNTSVNLTEHGLGYKIENVASDIIVKDEEYLVLDSLRFKCIYTPGHTECSVCWLIGDDLFCGDTLFLRSCGRWDLPTGNYTELADSIRNRLYTLPDDVSVHSGHGRDTSIGYEKKYNLCIAEL